MENGKWKMENGKMRHSAPRAGSDQSIFHFPFSIFHSPRKRRACPEPCRRAFTLIELMVVIGIIAILIGITVPLIRKVQMSAHGAATNAQLSTIASAIQQYYADFHAYPGPLPNNQLGGAFQYDGPQKATVADPSGSGAFLDLKYYDPVAMSSAAFPGTSQIQHITGTENLVLGLLGGLQFQAGPPIVFSYNPAVIFSDVPKNSSPNPQGAASLNYSRPKRTPAYLQVRAGDISHPDKNVNNGQFTDEAGRFANDSIIPEFVDQYSDAMPILYLRANVGGTAIVGIGGYDDTGSAVLADSKGNRVISQYDLAQVIEYTRASAGMGISTTANKTNLDHHGLQYIGLFTPAVPSSGSDKGDIVNGWWSTTPGQGANGIAYFKDPNNPGTANVQDANTTPPTTANARQKDGYILISAGPDRVYGTPDDIIYPGTLQP